MHTPRGRVWILPVACFSLVLTGCAQDRVLPRRAEAVCRRLAMKARMEASAPPAVLRPSNRPTAGHSTYPVYFALAETSPAPEEVAPAGPEPSTPAHEPIDGKSFGGTLKQDLREAPRQVWSGTKHSFADSQNLLTLAIALGADRITRHNLDGRVRDHMRDHDTSLSETGDFGTVIGNPALHFGIAGAWYAVAVRNRDAKHHEMSKVMIEALAVNGLATMLLKVSMGDESPNGQLWGWPSGHTSSSVCFASVIHEYFGWKPALPLYLLAGYSAATRVEDREHDLSDLVFGAALGWVVGHSVVKGELPHVAGFDVLPYGGPDRGGLLFVKRW